MALTFAELFVRLAEIAQSQGVELYLIGGSLRDRLLGIHAEPDFDFTLGGDSGRFAQEVAQKLGGTATVTSRFLTAKVVFSHGLELDFASFRTERYEQAGKLPIVTPAASLSIDLVRRDFTINTLALPVAELSSLEKSASELEEKIVDLSGGLSDLKKRLIRFLHEQSFLDDPTRIFRALRYLVRIQGTLEEKTAQHLQAAVAGGALRTVSGQRVVHELARLSREGDIGQAVNQLLHYGIDRQLPLLEKLANIGRLSSGEDFFPKLYASLGGEGRARFIAAGFSHKQCDVFER